MSKKKHPKHRQRLVPRQFTPPTTPIGKKEPSSKKYRSEKYIQYIFRAEVGILESAAMERDLTDAQVLEALQALIGQLRAGKMPAFGDSIEGTNNLVAWRITQNWAQLPRLSTSDLAGCLSEVLESARTRSHMHGGRRGYLKYLEGFMRDMGVTVQRIPADEWEGEDVPPIPADERRARPGTKKFTSLRELKAGDTVAVKSGVRDPDFGIDISGWQGRIIDIDTTDSGTPLALIEWDAMTLKNMPDEMITQCEREGLDWTMMNLELHEIEPAAPRDNRALARIREEIEARHAWDWLGEQGPRIQQVLAGIDPDDELAALEAWDEYLRERLTFPFEAEVAEFQERGSLQAGDRVTVTGLAELDDLRGVMVNLQRKYQQYIFPLCDLEVIDRLSPNHQPVQDYAVWFANR